MLGIGARTLIGIKSKESQKYRDIQRDTPRGLTLICTVYSRAETFDRVTELVARFARKTLKNEKGCVEYSILEQRDLDTEDPKLVLMSQWKSQKALDCHYQQAYVKQHRKIVEAEDLVIRPDSIKIIDQAWNIGGNRLGLSN